MKTWTALFACLLLVLVVAGCIRVKRGAGTAGATMSVYGLAVTSRSKEYVQYFDKAATAFDAHLKSLGFSVTAKPTSVPESGGSYKAQRDTWYVGRYRGAQVYVKMRMATENMSGLDVDLSWEAEKAYAGSVEASARELQKQLSAWFEDYERVNRAP